MKILNVDKYYFIKGGAERYYFELAKVLEAYGHEVIPFSMQHPENFETNYAEYFVPNIEFNGLTPLQKMRQTPEILGRIIYSRKAKEAVTRLIEKTKPDIAHLHMIDHQLSPSILHAFRDAGIPVIQTCHQYKLVCPSYRLFVMHTNEVCERCISGDFYHAFAQKCLKDSRGASALVTIESYVHKWMKIYDNIDLFHVPSRFLGNKLIEGGFPEEKIWHNFYTINLEDYPYHPEYGDYCLYFGRLSEEKGIQTLLRAMKSMPETKLLVAGDGPYRAFLEGLKFELGLENVTFLGNKGGDELVKLVQNSRFIVVPSEWYDNSPLVIYEAFSMGKPAIVSTMGGMPELVDDGINGFHFQAGDEEELSDKVATLWSDTDLIQKFSKNAREKADREFSPAAHYNNIIQVYEKLVSEKKYLSKWS
ncbi:MAG: glycosyltransferase family 4 protein [Deferribacteres bacterium]|nr:glycosyltransferase family 4 protein [candidate division KSB1 bacterium]MCB9503750.1 glycosyltransferase family 4 protein [Deferribacteres bacterium]